MGPDERSDQCADEEGDLRHAADAEGVEARSRPVAAPRGTPAEVRKSSLARASRAKAAAAFKEVGAEMDKMLPDVLKEDQVKRFKQIRIQQLRNRAYSDADIQKSLKMTEDQIKKIKELTEAGEATIKEKTKDLGR